MILSQTLSLRSQTLSLRTQRILVKKELSTFSSKNMGFSLSRSRKRNVNLRRSYTEDNSAKHTSTITRPRLLSLSDGTRREIIEAMVENFTAPALASALRDREELLLRCAALASDPARAEDLQLLLEPFMKRQRLSTVGVKPDPMQMLPSKLDKEQLLLFKKRLSRIPREVASAFTAPRASVVVPLCHDDKGQPSVLFTRRSLKLKNHGGEVCFPGGMVDEMDASIYDTALRELEEELAIPAESVETLGILRCDWGEIQSITGVAVTPVVAFIGEIKDLDVRFNDGEVEDIFTVPLESIAKRTNWQLQDHAAPIFKAPHTIWGLTAYVLDRFLHRVLYHHRGNVKMEERPVSAYDMQR